jgi:hypothetical protein
MRIAPPSPGDSARRAPPRPGHTWRGETLVDAPGHPPGVVFTSARHRFAFWPAGSSPVPWVEPGGSGASLVAGRRTADDERQVSGGRPSPVPVSTRDRLTSSSPAAVRRRIDRMLGSSGRLWHPVVFGRSAAQNLIRHRSFKCRRFGHGESPLSRGVPGPGSYKPCDARGPRRPESSAFESRSASLSRALPSHPGTAPTPWRDQ